MTQVGERVKPVITSTSRSTISDGAVMQEPHLKDQLHKLSFQIVRHANTLRSIMSTELLGKTSAKANANWRGSDQVRFNSSTIPIHSKYDCSPKKDALRFRIESTLYQFSLSTTYFLLIVDVDL
jgi:hypothetical protein